MYAKLLARMCDLIAPLVWNFCPSKRIVAELKNLSGGLNLSRGLNMVGST